jgi:hypothetical protein
VDLVDFPALKSLQTERERFLERLAEAESNKEGVEINVASCEGEIVGVQRIQDTVFHV